LHLQHLFLRFYLVEYDEEASLGSYLAPLVFGAVTLFGHMAIEPPILKISSSCLY
jgi:hypothetical protein